MSLRSVHLFFIALSTLTLIGFGAWCIQVHLTHGTLEYLPLGIVNFLIAGGLLIYGIWFFRKTRNAH